MKLSMCAVLDSAVNAFNRPFAVPSTPFALRSFADEVNRDTPDNPMKSHPEDYSLWLVGYYDDSIGLLEPQIPPVIIGKALDVLVRD